jgi:SAM-dependent methyltransferase
VSAIWHDLECGGYVEDLSLWRALAAEYGDPVFEIGSGTGRVALDLARQGHEVTALDHVPALSAELARRAAGLTLQTVVADARDFELGARFALILVPMQTIQLLGGVDGRRRFLRCARRHMQDAAIVAIAIADKLELYELVDGSPGPLPDIRELDGVVYSSQPTAVRADGDGFVLERRRETIDVSGERAVEQDVIHLDRLTPEQLEREAAQVGLEPAGRAVVAETPEYVGSAVVILRG